MVKVPEFLQLDAKHRTTENFLFVSGIALLIAALNLPLTQATCLSTVSLSGYPEDLAWIYLAAASVAYVAHFGAQPSRARLMLQAASWAGIVLVGYSLFVLYQWRDWHLENEVAFGFSSAMNQDAFLQYLSTKFGIEQKTLLFVSGYGRDFSSVTNRLDTDQQRELISISGIRYHVLPYGFGCLATGVACLLLSARRRIRSLTA